MAGIAKRSFEAPDERRTPDKTNMLVVDLGSVKAGRMRSEPGWNRSECIKPAAGTESCQTHHVGTAVLGQFRVHHDDGTEVVLGAGDAYAIEPGHDAWWSVLNHSWPTSSIARPPVRGWPARTTRRPSSDAARGSS